MPPFDWSDWKPSTSHLRSWAKKHQWTFQGKPISSWPNRIPKEVRKALLNDFVWDDYGDSLWDDYAGDSVVGETKEEMKQWKAQSEK